MGFRVGKIKVTMKLLGALLRLPEGCSVEGVGQSYDDLRAGSFTVYLQGAGLPESEEQDADAIPQLHAKYDVEAGVTKFRRVK